MTRPGAIRLIVNADDLGWTEPVNAGIFRAHREGVVTSATLAANMPAAAAALEELPHTDLGVGVHLNACQGPALSKQAREVLAAEGGAMNRTAASVLRLCLLRPRRTLAAVEAEFAAQVEWCLGRHLRPTHVDTHRHLHAWPVVFRLVARLCAEYHIPFVRRFREVLDRVDLPPAPRRQRMLSQALNLLGQRCRRIAPERFVTTGTLGVAHTGCIEATFLLGAIDALGPGVTEIMVHPGYAAGLTIGQTRLVASRQTEMEALCDPQVAERLAARKVTLTHYGRLR